MIGEESYNNYSNTRQKKTVEKKSMKLNSVRSPEVIN
jgi:hypothetical protein